MWLNAILKSYLERESAGLIPNPYPQPKYQIMEELKQLDLMTFYHKLNSLENEDVQHKWTKK